MPWEMTKFKLGHFHSGKMHRPVSGIPASGAPTCWWDLKGKESGVKAGKRVRENEEQAGWGMWERQRRREEISHQGL